MHLSNILSVLFSASLASAVSIPWTRGPSAPRLSPQKRGPSAALLQKRASGPTPAQRGDWVSSVRDAAKQGKVAAQWYPGYAADLLPVSQIDWSNVNLMFWFVQTTDQGGLDTTVDGPLTELVLAAAMHNVPVVATVGGWDGGLFFSSLVADDSGRKSLAQQFATFADTHMLAGMEVDWEYPGQQGIGCNNISHADLANLGSFLSELRTSLGPDRLISIAVSSGGLVGADGNPATDVSDVANSLDFVNIMNYDTYGQWTSTTGPNAALSADCSKDAAFSAISSAQVYSAAGVPKTKILMGMPGYGYAYTTTSSTLESKSFPATFANGTKGNVATDLYQAKKNTQPEGDETDSDGTGTDVCGNPNAPSGIFLYKSLLNYGFLSTDGTKGLNGFTRAFDECTSTPYLFNPSNNTLISYDDASSLAIKASWAQDNGLAGTTIFDSTGPTDDVFKAVKAASSGDRASLWSQGILTIENATVTDGTSTAGSGTTTTGGGTGSDSGSGSGSGAGSSLSQSVSSSSSSSSVPAPTTSAAATPTSSAPSSGSTGSGSSGSSGSGSSGSGSGGSSGSSGSSGSGSAGASTKGAYVKCTSKTTWSLCDGSTGVCTPMGKVAAGTTCDASAGAAGAMEAVGTRSLKRRFSKTR